MTEEHKELLIKDLCARAKENAKKRKENKHK